MECTVNCTLEVLFFQPRITLSYEYGLVFLKIVMLKFYTQNNPA